MTYVLATANPGKVREMREVLSQLDIDVVTRDDMGITMDIPETGTTFTENATLKATAICKLSGMPAIADDSGLVVAALGGEPGLYSSSYGGVELTDTERYMYLLKKMENAEQRAAKFVSTIICAFPNGDIIEAVGECHGTITIQPRGAGGFGYDPVFLPDGMKKTMGEMTDSEKNKISHRGAALRNFATLLKEYNLKQRDR